MGLGLEVLLLFVFLGVVPIALGLPWMIVLSKDNWNRTLGCFPLGYFIELALFHYLAVPFTFLGGSFRGLAVVYIFTVVFLCIISIRFVVRHQLICLSLPKFSGWEIVYLAVFIVLFLYQLYNAAVGDTTIWSYDDAAYVTWSADAIRYNRIMTIDTDTGIATAGVNNHMLHSSLLFPGFLSLITDIPVTTMNRTVLEVFYILLAYTVYGYMASVLFKKNDNRLIFLIFLSVLHIFGYYSPYSISFRILGPNYQGKAVLASSLFPFFFAFLTQKMQEEYDWRIGLALMLLSTSAIAFTMFGAATFVLNITLVVVLSLFRRERKWKHMWYLIWGYMMPVLYGGVFFVLKYFRW